jgi:hypothetical protein
MVKPSPQLQARMRFTTKQVAGGFYRGTRTGAMGAHTRYGGYIIDYRKTRHYAVPDFKGFKVSLRLSIDRAWETADGSIYYQLTPYVSLEISDPGRVREDRKTGEAYEISRFSGMEFLKDWKENNPQEFEDELAWQHNPDRPNEQAQPEEWKFSTPTGKPQPRTTPVAQVPVSESLETEDSQPSSPLK